MMFPSIWSQHHEDREGGESVEKCVIETSRVELFLAPSLFSIVLVVFP